MPQNSLKADLNEHFRTYGLENQMKRGSKHEDLVIK